MEFRAMIGLLIELLNSSAIESRVFSDAHLAFACCRAGTLDSCVRVVFLFLAKKKKNIWFEKLGSEFRSGSGLSKKP
jgi:hypothetical protein